MPIISKRKLYTNVAAYAPVAIAYTGPGDVVGSAIAWWGLRAYTSASIGANAVRLRESGGDTEQNFSTISGGGLDLAAIATFQGANSVFITTLYDQVGSRHLTRTLASAQPQLVLSGVGSLPVMRMTTAASQGLSGAALSQAQSLTMSVFAKRTAGFTVNTFLLGDTNCTLGYRNAANFLDLYAGGSDQFVAATDSTFHAIQFIAAGASSNANVDGAASAAISPGTGGLTTFQLNGIYSSFADVDVTEFGVWAGTFSGTQSTNMSANQHTYWGV